jgi:hypothetical protein
MAKRTKYDFERLNKYCKENNITLLEDYSCCKLTKDEYLKSKCSYENCDNIVNKRFRELEKAGSYCLNCIKIKATNIRKNTCFKKYGVNNITHTEIYKQNVFVPKYNYKSLKEFCDKNKISLLNDYENIRLHSHYYVEGKCQNNDCFNTFNKKIHKLLNTNGMCNQCIFENAKEIRKNTNLKTIGYESYYQVEEIKLMNKFKYKKTMIEKYGVEIPAHNSEIMDKIIKNSHSRKKYEFPSGRIEIVQGYEPFGLNELIIKDKIDESDIIVGAKNVPQIKFIGPDGNSHRYYVDIFIPSQNKCIEVKSTYTYKKDEQINILKQEAAKNLGYNFEFRIYDNKGNRINISDD